MVHRNVSGRVVRDMGAGRWRWKEWNRSLEATRLLMGWYCLGVGNNDNTIEINAGMVALRQPLGTSTAKEQEIREGRLWGPFREEP